ncbi:MAG: Calx-beta domain-containing protein [Aestuariivirgaceae bacterium]
MGKPAVVDNCRLRANRSASASTGTCIKKLTLVAAVTATLLTWHQATALAAEFTLQDGKRMEGEIVYGSASSVIIRQQSGALVQLSRRAIDSVRLVTNKRKVLSGALESWDNGVYEIRTDDDVFKVQLGRIIAERADLPKIIVKPSKEKEDAKKLVFDLTLSKSVKQEVLLIYSTIDGTALAGSDYEAQRGSVILKPGTTSATVGIPILDDDVAEGDETFQLLVTSDLDSASVEVNRGSATILDNEAPATANQ